jgi:PPOX class probable F420-dependent enzyme
MNAPTGVRPPANDDTRRGISMATRQRVRLRGRAQEWLRQPNFAFLATLMEDGSPHVSPVWVDAEDGHVVVNTAEGRVKARNVHNDGRVALSVSPVDAPYAHVDIRGHVVDLIEGDEAERHIHHLHRKYHGGGSYPLRPGERRLKVVIEPVALKVSG